MQIVKSIGEKGMMMASTKRRQPNYSTGRMGPGPGTTQGGPDQIEWA